MQTPGRLQTKTRLIIRRFADHRMFELEQPYGISEDLGNVGLNEGIQLLWDIVTGILPNTSGWHSGAAHIGVGSDSTAAVATQGGLQSGHAWGSMLSGWPARSGQCVAFKASFPAEVGNAAWAEFTMANKSGAGIDLVRKVSAQGTKTSGQVWEALLELTLS